MLFSTCCTSNSRPGTLKIHRCQLFCFTHKHELWRNAVSFSAVIVAPSRLKRAATFLPRHAFGGAGLLSFFTSRHSSVPLGEAVWSRKRAASHRHVVGAEVINRMQLMNAQRGSGVSQLWKLLSNFPPEDSWTTEPFKGLQMSFFYVRMESVACTLLALRWTKNTENWDP